jgi:hypothetical protein
VSNKQTLISIDYLAMLVIGSKRSVPPVQKCYHVKRNKEQDWNLSQNFLDGVRDIYLWEMMALRSCSKAVRRSEQVRSYLNLENYQNYGASDLSINCPVQGAMALPKDPMKGLVDRFK